MGDASAAIRLVAQPDPAIVARLADEITAFNFATTGIHDGREFGAAIHDDEGGLAAGVHGWTWGGTCWIERLWVSASHRRQGLGSRLLAAVQSEARDRGCTQLALTTHTFQAPDFYRRHGFEIVGEVPQYPAGHAYFLMRRQLG
jgi:GNAT superfamily N-acetyltransferase